MFGTQMKRKDSDISQIIENEIIEDFMTERNKLRDQAKDDIIKIQSQNKIQYNESRKAARKYNVDDLVTIAKTQFATGAKLEPKTIGPYKITKVKANDRYEVEKIGETDGPKKTDTAADYIKPWATMNMLLIAIILSKQKKR